MGHSNEFLIRNRKRMAEIDEMSPKLRALIHEFNYGLVKQFLNAGVTKPSVIRHLIRKVQEGSAAYSNGPARMCPDCHGLGRIPDKQERNE